MEPALGHFCSSGLGSCVESCSGELPSALAPCRICYLFLSVVRNMIYKAESTDTMESPLFRCLRARLPASASPCRASSFARSSLARLVRLPGSRSPLAALSAVSPRRCGARYRVPSPGGRQPKSVHSAFGLVPCPRYGQAASLSAEFASSAHRTSVESVSNQCRASAESMLTMGYRGVC